MKAKADRNAEIIRRWDARSSNMQELADEFGISRQRVEQIIHRRRYVARAAVYDAVKAGEITPPTSCQECESSGGAIEAHHPDYSEPLSVEWLCRNCHVRADRRDSNRFRGRRLRPPVVRGPHPGLPPKPERNAKILRLAKAGVPYKEIAQDFGLSQQRAQYIAQKMGAPRRQRASASS